MSEKEGQTATVTTIAEEIAPHYRQKIPSWGALFKQLATCRKVLQDGRNTTKQIDFDGLSIVIKAFKKPSPLQGWIYTYCRKSKARRAYEYALHLNELGIATHPPIAYREERKCGRLHDSYFASERIEYDLSMRDVLQQGDETDQGTLKSFVEFTFSLHRSGVLHLDYTPGNILIKRNQKSLAFSIIDINRMRFGKVSEKDGIENFFNLTSNEKILRDIANLYADCRGGDSDRYYEILQLRQDKKQRQNARKKTIRKILGIHHA